MRRTTATLTIAICTVALGACGGSKGKSTPSPAGASSSSASATGPSVDPHDVYAADRPNQLSAAVRGFRSLVYVPNSESATVTVIDPNTYRVIDTFATGALPQHVTPSYDLQTLWVDNDLGDSLTPIDPRTGKPGGPVPVTDPYNLYFTPDGRRAIVVAERLERLDFRDPKTMKLKHSLSVPCRGVDHLDFTADGRYALASCEFGSSMLVIDIANERVVRPITLPRTYGAPQDVKLAPDGSVFYVADQVAGGVWLFDAHSFKETGFIATGAGTHGLYVSRDSRYLYISNRSEGSVSVLDFATRKLIHKWPIPGGSPDMGGVSADGKVLWLSGRYSAEVYAIRTTDGKLVARIPVGSGPHGLCVYPQPGRYSLGHTGVFR